MLPDDTKIISADDHVIEHPAVWQDRLSAKHRELGPRVVGEDGIPVWFYDGRRYKPLGLDAVAGDDPSEFKLTPKAFEAMRPGCYDPDSASRRHGRGRHPRLCAFPQFPRFAGQTFLEADDRELALACVQAWNDFMIDEWCAADRTRLIPMSIVPMWDAQLCADEIRRTVDKGARAITFSENPAALGLPSFWSTHGTRCSTRSKSRTPPCACTSARPPVRSCPTTTLHFR